ncbi:TonB-dependent receptor [Duganella sp. CT11-25]|jgi:iron complex outermembrane receptor protein|uniref:TonB-dependent receptor n=1 Tax=unclassified Duganella TaxID=2636909 RepID=UPI0039AEA5F0
MMMETVLSRSVRLMFSGSVAAVSILAMPAFAQDAAAPGAAIQRVEITGSSIKRASAETASPVQMITRDELMKSGKTTVAEFLQTLTVDGAGSLPTGFGSGFAAGSTAISLRGLGATSTLVLLNGRRMAPFARADDGQKSFTDLSTIPMQLVERIEVLKDGASSTYGADAIAGVVNIILRKDFEGVTIKADTGTSRYSDMNQNNLAVTVGKGNLDEDKYNVVFNVEYKQSDALAASDRKDRGWIGHGDIRPWGYLQNTQYMGGFITPGASSPTPTGALRDPKTGNYTSLGGCGQFSQTVKQDAAGGCLWSQDQFRGMQPEVESLNLYTRGTLQVNSDLQVYTELGYSKRNSSFMLAPVTATPNVTFPATAANPQGIILYSNDLLMAGSHPQNIYGVNTRLRYSMFDLGPSNHIANNDFSRIVLGAKGSNYGWDWDAGFTHSESKLYLEWTNQLNMNVLKSALGDPTSKYFPYYIGAEAYKNPASLYAALRVNASSNSTTQLDIVDFKASRELFALPGGNMGLAIGGEHRREKLDNPSLTGSEDGSTNLSYVAAKGDTRVSAVYAEVLAPVLKTVELSGALRYDHYANFNSTTPKLGAKWTPIKSFAVRGTYTEGFRAPGVAESNLSSQSTGTSSVVDPVRCPNNKPAAGGATSLDCNIQIGAVKVGNPNLSPEKSKGYTLGLVWDPLNDTNLSLDAWKIRRTNEINPLSYVEAAALPTAIRADNNLVVDGVVIPGTGTLLISKAPYQNSSYTEVKGVDLDVKQRLRLGAYGKATINLVWSHVASWVRADKNQVFQFAGTHGNCDTSDCAGTPKDKINLITSWDKGDWNLSGTVNYRSDMKNIRYEGAPCAVLFANGQPSPNGACRLPSFTTLDMSTRYTWSKSLQLFASMNNVLDRIAPLDALTYGGMSFNPMDASGATGRYVKVGLQYKFD